MFLCPVLLTTFAHTASSAWGPCPASSVSPQVLGVLKSQLEYHPLWLSITHVSFKFSTSLLSIPSDYKPSCYSESSGFRWLCPLLTSWPWTTDDSCSWDCSFFICQTGMEESLIQWAVTSINKIMHATCLHRAWLRRALNACHYSPNTLYVHRLCGLPRCIVIVNVIVFPSVTVVPWRQRTFLNHCSITAHSWCK